MGSIKQRVRPLAVCIFRRGDKIFVSRGHDSATGETFYRPIGGGIEFLEPAADCVRREVHEEIGADITDLTYLGTLENIFTYEGESGHEIFMIFDGKFVDEARNADDYTTVGTDDGDKLFTAMWKPLAFFADGNAPLYPEGLLDLIYSSVTKEEG